MVATCETIDGDHGRIEVRRHAVCHDVGWLFSDRRYPGEVAFPGLPTSAAIGIFSFRLPSQNHSRDRLPSSPPAAF